MLIYSMLQLLLQLLSMINGIDITHFYNLNRKITIRKWSGFRRVVYYRIYDNIYE